MIKHPVQEVLAITVDGGRDPSGVQHHSKEQESRPFAGAQRESWKSCGASLTTAPSQT